MRNLCLILAFGVVALVGCGAEKDYGTQGGDVDVTAEIKRIESNPKIPQQAKDIAIGQLKSRQNQSPQAQQARGQ